MVETRLIDLVNKEVAGKKDNIRFRGGKYHYDYQDIPKIRTLEKVYIRFEKVNGVKQEWLCWTWKPEAKPMEHDCGFSGIMISANGKQSEIHPREQLVIDLQD